MDKDLKLYSLSEGMDILKVNKNSDLYINLIKSSWCELFQKMSYIDMLRVEAYRILFNAGIPAEKIFNYFTRGENEGCVEVKFAQCCVVKINYALIRQSVDKKIEEWEKARSAKENIKNEYEKACKEFIDAYSKGPYGVNALLLFEFWDQIQTLVKNERMKQTTNVPSDKT